MADIVCASCYLVVEGRIVDHECAVVADVYREDVPREVRAPETVQHGPESAG